MFAKPGLLRHYPLSVDDPDSGKFEIHMDFSSQGLAACLYQTQCIDWEAKLGFIDAAGQKTMPYKRNYHSSEGELVAIHFAVNRWKQCLHSKPFIVLTDSKTVEHWSTMRNPGASSGSGWSGCHCLTLKFFIDLEHTWWS